MVDGVTSLELLPTVLLKVVPVKLATMVIIAKIVHLIITCGEVKMLILMLVLVLNVVSYSISICQVQPMVMKSVFREFFTL